MKQVSDVFLAVYMYIQYMDGVVTDWEKKKNGKGVGKDAGEVNGWKWSDIENLTRYTKEDCLTFMLERIRFGI